MIHARAPSFIVAVFVLAGCSGATGTVVDGGEGEGAGDVVDDETGGAGEGEGEGEGESDVVGRGVLRINEVDAAGSPDWIELTNIGNAPASLAGLTVTDDLDDPEKAALPVDADAVVEVGGFVVVELDDDSVGFALAADEEVGVFDHGALIDSVDWDDGDSVEGGSIARREDGTGDFHPVDDDTRGESNE